MRVLSAALIGACLMATPALAIDKQEAQKGADEWAAAFNRGDFAAVAAWYQPDATIFPPGSDMIHGRKNIEAFWEKASQQIHDVTFQVTDVKTLGSPDWAREQGTATLHTRGDKPQELHGKYVVIYQKIGGKWLLDSDIWNLSMPEGSQEKHASQ
jgi:uncharacterized protein (TIGR02246 family)